MTVPLALRIQLDSQEDTKIFLANGAPGVDFALTRDCATASGSIYTSKYIQSEWAPTSSSRGMLRPYLAHVFGKVAAVRSTAKTCIARMECPTDISCYAQDMFDKQVRTLRRTLDDDSSLLFGAVSSDWFSSISELCAVERSFFIHIPMHLIQGPHIVVPGQTLELIAGMERVDSEEEESEKTIQSICL
ncbi:hypothetical protein C8R43DRAFT_1132357 [Mycena crocata]|nr:hypothetical protein C8R43DRAFT_1132357 [Mycena crocata]